MSNSTDYSKVQEFVAQVVTDMGLDLEATVAEADDHVSINLAGADEAPLLKRKGEGLDALQHLVNSVFRHDGDARRLVVDCGAFRKLKDRELQQMAHFVMEKVRNTGDTQEMGPFNSYARRIVHLEVNSSTDLVSESQGDGALKTVIISRRNPAGRK
jgi:spoIIIJ-associated protein